MLVPRSLPPIRTYFLAQVLLELVDVPVHILLLGARLFPHVEHDGIEPSVDNIKKSMILKPAIHLLWADLVRDVVLQTHVDALNDHVESHVCARLTARVDRPDLVVDVGEGGMQRDALVHL